MADSAFEKSSIATPVTVPNGGTGATTHTDHGVLVGSGTGAVSVTATGSAGEILTSNGASSDPTFQAAGSVPNILYSTIFETAGRFGTPTAGSGTVTFGNLGCVIDTNATGSSNAVVSVTPTEKDTVDGSPVFTAYLKLEDLGTDMDAFFGMGVQSIFTTGSFGETSNHIGILIERASSGTVTLKGSQSTGTQSLTASLATPGGGEFIMIKVVVNGTASVDYYVSIDSAPLSSATNLATNVPTGGTGDVTMGVGNIGAASATLMHVKAISYEKTA